MKAACLRAEIKGDIDFITKTKKLKNCFVILLVCCVFFLAENLYFESQTNKQKTLKLP